MLTYQERLEQKKRKEQEQLIKNRYTSIFNSFYDYYENEKKVIGIDGMCKCNILSYNLCLCDDPNVKILSINGNKYCNYCDKWLCRCTISDEKYKKIYKKKMNEFRNNILARMQKDILRLKQQFEINNEQMPNYYNDIMKSLKSFNK